MRIFVPVLIAMTLLASLALAGERDRLNREWTLRDSRTSVDEQGRPLR
jgi:hypothetical protein